MQLEDGLGTKQEDYGALVLADVGLNAHLVIF